MTAGRAGDLAVLFLARGVDGGRSAAEAFFDSYRDHPAGCQHSLVVLVKGWEGLEGLSDVMRWTAAFRGRTVSLPDDGFDIGAYFRALPEIHEEWLCMLNTFCRIRADDWLRLLQVAARGERVGAAGATGSWESISHGVLAERPRRRWKSRARQLARLVRYAALFPAYPNPHLRSTAFLTRRDLFSAFAQARRVPREKEQAHRLESGRRGFSQFLHRRGLELVIAGADGRIYRSPSWRASGTFRIPGHPNLLIHDNQTRGFDSADRATQNALHRAAWGRDLETEAA